MRNQSQVAGPKMASEKQIAANRRNAARSTGPKTAQKEDMTK